MPGGKSRSVIGFHLLLFSIAFAAMMINGCGGGGGGGPANKAPTVDAGTPQAVTLPAAALLDGTVDDDGLPNPPGALTITWSKVSGPSGPVVFSPNPNTVDTTASFYEAGTYVLRLTANDGRSVASDEVTITVSPVPRANRPPAVDAGPPQSVTLPAAALLDGTVTDDGLPSPPGAVATTWSKVSGPSGAVNFANPNAVDTTASFPAAGTYVLSLTANDGEFMASDNVTVTVTATPPTPTPSISLLPEQTDFGAVILGKSAEKNIQIANTGNGDLTITQITLTNPATNPFSMTSDSCSDSVISPSSSCGLTIRFAPAAQDDYLGSLDIPSNDPGGPVSATLAGKGRALNVSINSVARDQQTVQVIVSVRNQLDAPVTTLSASNFSIAENGSPQTILNVSNIVNSPLSVGMVLDYSSSMIPFTAKLETASKSFVDLLNPVSDEAEVIKFATDIAVMRPFTQDIVALKAAIDEPFPHVRFGTAFYDALSFSILSTSLRSNPRLAIVAVSDGEDANSTKTINDVTSDASYNNVQIFTIGIGAADNTTMQELATETGGQYFFDPDASDLATVYSTISEILSNEYTIEYQTSSPGGSTISIDVMVDDNGQLGEVSREATI